jgi:Asp-tRNA(Asn)/Glu-tRNA(Gln) amidotransferase A subunit family amidase
MTSMLPTIHATAADIRAGHASPLDILEACLVRIDQREERVKAWVFVDRDAARADAERATAELRKGYDRGPLHGIPIGIKDIFDVYDWPTAAGSRRWAQSYARHDAPAIQRLRHAGAVLVGKTVTTQYASFDPPPTRNPWNRDRTPGGSSSGSAAAVASGMCLGALGSQTGGSITRPASFCGVAGCKPTYGRVSKVGVLPLAHSMDHVGPIAYCVRDLAILLQAIAGYEPSDSHTASVEVPDYLHVLHEPLRPPRLGRLHGLFNGQAAPVVHALMDSLAKEFTSAGATVVDMPLPDTFSDVLTRHRIVMGVEAAEYHAPRLRRHPEEYLPNIRSLLEEGLATTPQEYARSKAHQKQLTQDMEACFEGVDVLLTPAATGPAPSVDTTGDPAFNSPWSYTGLPTVSLPARRDPEGMPLAIQLIGRLWTEPALFAAAAWCEQVLGYGTPLPPV